MKQRFSSLDVKVIAHELSAALLTLRVSNIYDLSTKIFLIKFAKPEHKQQIIIDSGFRVHLTSFARATAADPSNFVTRLRKFLKTRRVTKVEQVGTDRVIEVEFSEGRYKLYLEFYAAGNIVLTDVEGKVLALQRIVAEGEGQEELRVGLKYELSRRQNYGGVPELTPERLRGALEKAVETGEGTAGAKKGKKNAKDGLRKALAVSITEYPPMLVDHSMRLLDFNPELKPAEVLESQDTLDHLLRCLQKAQKVIEEITSSKVTKGYIIAKRKEGVSEDDASRKGLIYDDFHPFRPRQFEDDPTCIFLEHDGFNITVDEFFSSIEGQRLESKLEEREATAKRKLEAARHDQAKRLGGLVEVQEMHLRKAGALEANAERVQEAMDAVNGLIAQGMDWVEIGKLIELEQKRGNPVALAIKLPLKLEENTIILLLDEEMEVDEDDSAYETASEASDGEDDAPAPKKTENKEDTRLSIDINLSLTPYANSREYYHQKKTAKLKQEKTVESSVQALRSQEAKIAAQLKKGLKTEKAILRSVRKQLWFEKFAWFVSSDGYLVLGGKDAQQNEMLYKRHLKTGDIYLSADIQGAATVIVKNNPKTPDAPIPPSTLSQAGTMAVATSTAWDAKAGMSAWWVTVDQVSKQTSTGDFLPVGSFVIRGKKNFLPSAQLILGFGAMFQISEESKAKRYIHRLQDEYSTMPPTAGSVTEVLVLPSTATSVSAGDDKGSVNGDETNSDVEDDEKEEPHSNLLQSGSHTIPGDLHQTDNDFPRPGAKVQEWKVLDPKDQDGDEDHEIESTDDTISIAPIITKQAAKQVPPQRKRGQKAKAKKIATKYKDQDEEDRLMAQQLLGSVAGQQKAEAEAKAKAAKEAELAFQKERRRAQHQRAQKEIAEHEAARKAMLEEDMGMDEEEEQRLTSIDALVGTPLPGDEILEAIPMCAPYDAMNKCKYKVKLQPGTVKKGKAVKEILGRWTSDVNLKWVDQESRDKEKIWPRELELLKGWRVEDITNTIAVSRVRVMMSGNAAAASKGGEKGKMGSRGSKGKKM
ncbi:putative nuclear export mediator factor Nemf [Calycina marina]|uniref:Ribosome quality control complex subunit 2 n=1 Tax=Calycina marina TaxID=1763456 RepID=A0A9P7YYZ4_9HELO|nr:putative nuclear export mediator factor Nemf [Calycina marina]